MHRQIAAIAVSVLAAIVVIDGDTVRVGDKKYRLLGFDTPETRYAKCGSERQAGYAATARLKELIETTDARLEPTGRSCKYQRECAHLFLDGENAADIMVREGHGVPYNGRGQRKSWCD